MVDPFQKNSSTKKISGVNNLKKKNTKPQGGIPTSVANRMARRVAITSGVPTITGMGIFIASYLLVSRGITDIPPVITLLSSAAFFFLGLLGLSFGLFSSSWETSPGSFLGLENIRPNITKVRESFQANKTTKE
ncbi:PAM68 family protein [Prochlorococcus sp. MIT 1341]|uniref:PAM68 family protein n=1 Tax=Prochlorococcus sp. MIT 1341 TaxID=3096221 RepID=UPI002A764312|nr:PAM68 family protein [Prochlorococcus sp. MIT 1341]